MPGVVIKFDASPIRPPEAAVISSSSIFCPCDFRCDFEELVFADSDDDGIKNDKTDFLFKRVISSDTILIELLKEGSTITTITNDDYGDYYFGFDNQPLYVGWQADWTKIFDAFSGGRYQVKVTTTILGDSSEFLSRYFRLNTFDILAVNRTVKLETIQNGNFENSEFDFTELLPGGWPTSIRLPGTFGNMQPTIERDVYEDPSYRDVQNRDFVVREYKLNADFVPDIIQNRISTQDALGNQIFITSYDVLQGIEYQKYPLVVESFGDVRYDGLGNTYFEITLSDRQKNIIKTNV